MTITRMQGGQFTLHAIWLDLLSFGTQKLKELLPTRVAMCQGRPYATALAPLVILVNWDPPMRPFSCRAYRVSASGVG